ncbi:MAG: hypothetical protein IPL53_20540 [Ignavibacteria bacterium]|nr:hypothetical protein [Ignavibacteria bacterium]
MKKKYAIFATIIIANLISICVYSQSVIFTQNFESVWTTPNTLSPSWSGTTVPSNNQWHKNSYTTGWSSSGGSYSPAGANSTASSARFHSFDAANNSIGEIITPAIDFSPYSNNKRLVFYLTNASGTDKIDVYLSLDGGASYGLSVGTYVLSGTGYWSLYSVDLGNINSSNVKIKFTATSDFGTSDTGIDEIFVYDAIPLTGVKSIDAFGDYTTFKSAIEDLNKHGVGTGGITFNVTPNQTFTENLPILSVSGTELNPVIFQKSGSGNNPVIKPTGGSGTADYGFALVGADYITIDGIDININSGNAVEYGF